jgi:hypothetical protein
MRPNSTRPIVGAMEPCRIAWTPNTAARIPNAINESPTCQRREAWFRLDHLVRFDMKCHSIAFLGAREILRARRRVLGVPVLAHPKLELRSKRLEVRRGHGCNLIESHGDRQG